MKASPENSCLERARQGGGKAEARIVALVSQHDDGSPIAVARQVEAGAHQRAADAAALAIGPHRHGRQCQRGHGLAGRCVVVQHAEQDMADDLIVLDRDELPPTASSPAARRSSINRDS